MRGVEPMRSIISCPKACRLAAALLPLPLRAFIPSSSLLLGPCAVSIRPHAEHGMAAISLSSRANQLRQSLDSSHKISQEACRVLDQYCNQLSDLERIVQPIVLKTQALTQIRENVKQARAKAEEVLDHLDASRKVFYRAFGQSCLTCRCLSETTRCRSRLASYKARGLICLPSSSSIGQNPDNS